jgi:hypothetical protein
VDSNPPIRPLFAYGTLRDVDYQRELFGRTFPMRAARVHGFVVVTTPSGYLAATARRGASEDLAVYARIDVDAQLPGGTALGCQMYVQSAADGPEVTDGQLAARPRADVIAEIHRFRELFDASRQR